MKTLTLILSMGLLSACTAQTASQPSTHTTLAGSEWVQVNSDVEQFIQFKEDGSVAGFGGCNRFFGNYTYDDDRLEIGPLAATKKACLQLAQEQEFFNALETTKGVEATRLVLILKNESGETLMTLTRKDPD